jgi:hypothetical protein
MGHKRQYAKFFKTLNCFLSFFHLHELDVHFSSCRSLRENDPPMRTTLVPSGVGTIAAPSVPLGRFSCKHTKTELI